ncbi:MAG: GTP cyclohydrolase I FolE [Spirochaetes bacterium]|nr:GTP cyclohydrolase I FolE [Spirochaetota bacterium]
MKPKKNAAADIENAAKMMLTAIGENPKREGLVKTPQRFSESIQFLTQGYSQKLEDIISKAIFNENTRDMVIVKDIEFYSLCEHHIIPFFGVCHIGYIPNGRVLGLSKFARVVELFSRRLQLQERLTHEVADALSDTLKPLGIGVIIEAKHLCMMMRGVEKQNSAMITSVMLGCFRKNASTRDEFLRLIGK